MVLTLTKRLRELRRKAEILHPEAEITQIGKDGFWYRPVGESHRRLFCEWSKQTKKANREFF